MRDNSIFWGIIWLLSLGTWNLYHTNMSLTWKKLNQDTLYSLWLLWNVLFHQYFLTLFNMTKGKLQIICRISVIKFCGLIILHDVQIVILWLYSYILISGDIKGLIHPSVCPWKRTSCIPWHLQHHVFLYVVWITAIVIIERICRLKVSTNWLWSKKSVVLIKRSLQCDEYLTMIDMANRDWVIVMIGMLMFVLLGK